MNFQVFIRQHTSLFVAAVLIFCSVPSFEQDILAIEEFRKLARVGSPEISPDENFLLYSVTNMDIEHNTYQSTLKIFDFRRNSSFPLIDSAGDPKWSPDGGKISFTGDFGDGYGLYVSPLIVREGKLTLSPQFVAPIYESDHFLGHPTKKNYAWSPDGRFIAYTSADPNLCSERKDQNDPLEITRTLYKSRTGFSDNCITRIYLVPSGGGNSKPVTAREYDSHSLSWTEKGESLIFISNHTENPDDNYNNDIWKYEMSSGNTIQLTETVGTEHNPVANPDNEWIAFPATIRNRNTKDSPPENTFIYLMKNDGTDRLNNSVPVDRRATNPLWSPNGKWLFFKTQNEGKTNIYKAKRGKTPDLVLDLDAMIHEYSVGEDHLYFVKSTPGQPSEIYRAKHDGSDLQKITTETLAWTQSKSFSSFTEFWFDSFDGTRVQGFLAYPKNITEGSLIPVVHRIHGGPHGMYGYSFSDINELLVSKGMAVLLINPRGSTGYGQQFADGTIKAWGEGDYQDLMAGVDYALEHFSFLDSSNMVVTGGSYGGFMTNWVITQTDRYKAAVTVASVSNLISFYGTSLYQLLIETEFEGYPWEDYDLLWKYSPLKYVANVTTPTLIIHGELDMDVPITQAEEFYIALKKLGIPAKFVRYPNEGHGIRQPIHREHYFTTFMDWINKYLLEDSSASIK